jgi:hypothetical protein
MKTIPWVKEARRMWRDARWIIGNGQYAVLDFHAGRLMVSLWRTMAEAARAKVQLGYNPLSSGSISIVDLDKVRTERSRK